MYKFAAASENEPIVFGSSRPGYTNDRVYEWIEFMQARRIQHVCCLLPKTQLNRYVDLLGIYQQVFGVERVCWAPIEDFSLVTPEILVNHILPFLATADSPEERLCQRQNSLSSCPLLWRNWAHRSHFSSMARNCAWILQQISDLCHQKNWAQSLRSRNCSPIQRSKSLESRSRTQYTVITES